MSVTMGIVKEVLNYLGFFVLVAPCLGAGNAEVLEKIRFYEDRRILAAQMLVRTLAHPSREVKDAALVAIGRIGDPNGLDGINAILNSRDRGLRETAAFALSIMDNPTAVQIISQNIPLQSDENTAMALYRALGRAGSKEALPRFAAALTPKTSSSLAAAVCEGLGYLFSRPGAEQWDVPADLLAAIAKLATERTAEGHHCAFAMSRYRGPGAYVPDKPWITAAETTKNDRARGFLIRALAKVNSPDAIKVLIKLSSPGTPDEQRLSAIKSLGEQSFSAAMIPVLKEALTSNSTAVVVQGLLTAKGMGPKARSLAPLIENLIANSKSKWVVQESYIALAFVSPSRARALITNHLKPENKAVKNLGAIQGLASLGADVDLKATIAYLNGDELSETAAAIHGLSAIPDSSITQEIKTALKNIFVKGDAALSTMVAQLVIRHNWNDFIEPIIEVYPKLTSPDQLEAKIAIFQLIQRIPNSKYIPTIKLGIADSHPLVALAAAEAYEKTTGRPVRGTLQRTSPFTNPIPSIQKIAKETSRRVVIKTSRGEITLQMNADAPLTVINFLNLVRRGFYDGKIFHRVVPNFVVQGGDPRGDGFGGPGYFIRDELSEHPHERGVVGMATAGKDSGGSQFYINLNSNLHLNRRYTSFATVTSGMRVADKLEQGDVILSARVLP